ncbi:MAG: class I SAM-dependent methyltransferase [Promethearchaeota archaeon]
MIYNTDFILRVNEIYHDIENEKYDKIHESSFKEEIKFWEKIGKYLISKNFQKINLLDIGSGTGFVPLQIGNFLKSGDMFICSDLSKKILEVCKKKISEKKFKNQFEYMKLNGKQFNLKSNSFDYITMNSVLHHIPNFPIFFKEINRLLKISGLLVITHEPNVLFNTHRFLWNQFKILKLLSRKFKLNKILGQAFNISESTNHQYFLSKNVNEILLKEGFIKTPLDSNEISAIVDIHSSTAGGYHKERGINVSLILRRFLPNFKIIYIKTYNHLLRLGFENKITKFYDSILRRAFPDKGATLMVILKKIS